MGEADLVSLLAVLAHDEHEANDGADESPHVGQILIKGIVFPFELFMIGGLEKGELNYLLARGRNVGIHYQPIRDPSYFLGPRIAEERHDALLSFNSVFLDIDLAVNAQGIAKDEALAIIKEKLLVVLAAGVKLSVDYRNSYVELLPGIHQGLEISVTSAKGICCCIASGQHYLELLEKVRDVLAL